MTGPGPSAADLYRGAWQRLAQLAGTVPAAAWDAPTPCTGWNARHLAGHLVDGERQVRSMAVALEPRSPVTDLTTLAHLGGDDPAVELRHAAKAAEDTIAALTPQLEVRTPAGIVTVEGFLAMALIEPVVHGWDLSMATNQPWLVDDGAIEKLLAGVRQLGTQLTATGMYAPPLPTDDQAGPKEQLLAALGRSTTRRSPQP